MRDSAVLCYGWSPTYEVLFQERDELLLNLGGTMGEKEVSGIDACSTDELALLAQIRGERIAY